MEVLYQHLESSESDSFLTYHFKKKHYDVPLHYHPEVEIMYVLKGHGMRIVGDSIKNFKKDDLVIVGPGVSHVWKNDKEYYADNDLYTEYVVLFIEVELIQKTLFSLPELSHIKKMLHNSDKGIVIPKKKAKKFKPDFVKIAKSKGIDKLNHTINLLSELALIDNYKYLSERSFIKDCDNTDSNRLNRCIDYITDNFQDKVELNKVAELANMTSNSFCRYFKVRTTKTFSQYVTELRLNKACQLLIDTNNNIEDIAFDSGFNAMPNFYKQFNKRMEMSPKEYRAKYKEE